MQSHFSWRFLQAMEEQREHIDAALNNSSNRGPLARQFVYRYQHINEITLGNLKRGEYLFSTPFELNDGNEGYPKVVLHGDKEAYLRFTYWVFCHWAGSLYRLSDQKLSESFKIFNRISYKVSELSTKSPLLVGHYKKLLKSAIDDLGLSDDSMLCAFIAKSEKYLLNLLLTDINKHYSTLSFSKSATNPTMWGHYADADKGIIIVHATINNKIEVELPTPTFIRVKTDNVKIDGKYHEINKLGTIKKGELRLEQVSYRKNRPQINLFHWFSNKFLFSESEHHYDYPESFGAQQKPKDHEKFMLYKSFSWRYEKESRLILGNGFNRFDNVKENRIAVVGGITAIILGHRIAQNNFERVISALKILVQCKNELTPVSVIVLSLQPDESTFEYRLRVDGKVEFESGLASFIPAGKLNNKDMEAISYLSKHIMRKP